MRARTPLVLVACICKIWYSICRTMSDCNVLCGNVNDRSVRAIAVKPRAFGAPLCGVGDLTVRRGRANEATRAANADLHAAVLLAGRTSSDRSSAGFLNMSPEPAMWYQLWASFEGRKKFE